MIISKSYSEKSILIILLFLIKKMWGFGCVSTHQKVFFLKIILKMKKKKYFLYFISTKKKRK